MPKLLGLDPGLGTTGWGVIEANGNRLSHVANGQLKTDTAAPLPERLADLARQLEALIADAGVDGVNLRISAHGCLSDEPEAYGWNPPVLAAYRKQFGDGPIDTCIPEIEARLQSIMGCA